MFSYSFVDPVLLVRFHVCLCYAVLSVSCNLVITCWEKADLLAILCVMFLLLSHMCLYLIRIKTKGEVGTIKHV